MKLVGQTYQAYLGEMKYNGADSFAEIRMCGDKWVADARITPSFVGDQNTMPEARRALAAALRVLADRVES